MILRSIQLPVAITTCLVLLGLAIPQPDLKIACFVASFCTAGWVLIRLFQREREPAQRGVDDDKHIVLFKQPQSDDTAACPHCGEIVGLGIVTCPRCGREVRDKA